MAVDDFTGSFAQKNIQFTITPVISTVAGVNFYTPVLFIQDSDTAANFVAGAQAIGTVTTFDPFSYTTVAQGTLLAWLRSFYNTNTTTNVYTVVYNGTIHDITTQYNAVVNKGYFKILFFNSTETAQYKSDATVLAGLCSGQKGLSQAWINSSDATLLTTASGTLAGTLIASGYDAYYGYSASTSGNPLLVDLGLALSVVNLTGTPVGNSLDLLQTTGTLPSTGTSNVNLTTTQATLMETNNIAYWETVGNGTGAVALYGRKSLLGNVVGAQWISAYVNYICQINTANLLTQVGAPMFKNANTYATILNILNNALTPFVSMGRLSNLQITAPSFVNLPVTDGQTITIPRAWTATFNDRVGKVNVQGYLYITL